ncbi:MAG: tetratricopeptide repeat protein [Bacteroidales bacterium]|jgi:tetratricopeptide (TPR) repeat protein|nr:tetratricopeptide repeat protein [Bacteroidales bacterium]
MTGKRNRGLLLICFIVGLVFACSNKNQENQYASMPDELVKIYKAIEKEPNNASLYLDLSSYYMKTKQLDSALNNALVAIRLDSGNANVYVAVSDVYFSMNYIDNAEEMLEKAIALDNKNNEAYLKLGELYFLLKDYQQSEEILLKSLQQTEYNPRAYHILAWNYREKGDTSLAIRYYLTAVEQDPDYFDAYTELGILYHYRHNPLAIDYYNNALNIQPDNIQILYNIAMFYQETKEYEKALEKYRMILQIDENHKYALHNIGWIYLMGEDKFEEAVVFFSKAIEQDTTYIEAIYNRGLSFEQLKKYDNARQDYMYSLRLITNYPLAIEGLNRLDKLQSLKRN